MKIPETENHRIRDIVTPGKRIIRDDFGKLIKFYEALGYKHVVGALLMYNYFTNTLN